MTYSQQDKEASAVILDKLLRNPKTRRATLKAYKENYPDASVPEIDAAEPLERRLDQLENRDGMQQAQARWNESRQAARASGYNGERLNRLENWMERNGVVDHRIAMRASPGSTSSSFDFFEGVEGNREKILSGDPKLLEQWVDEQIDAAIAEVRGY